MEFPFYLRIFGHSLHPHTVCEALGYGSGARLYFWLRRREAGPPLSTEDNLWLLIGCIFGAWVGSKLLAWAEMPSYYGPMLTSPAVLLGGKTIVGGLLGGWIGIEAIKKWRGITRSTGDAFVLPLALGTAIGRIGCFLTGLSDHTYGVSTGLPWGVDFGDGIRRHPTQLYESIFALGTGLVVLFIRRDRCYPPGAVFRFYFVVYLGFRFFIEFIKPREVLWLNLSAIQLASIVGLIFSLVSLARLTKWSGASSSH